MRKFFLIACLILTFFCFGSNLVLADDPININSWTDLAKIGNDESFPLNGHYVLQNNLSSANADYIGIGNDWTPIGQNDPWFTGIFDGNNHSISDLTINKPTEHHVGLFGASNGGFQIINLRLRDVNITGSHLVGGIIGYNYYGTIDNCSVTGVINSVSVGADPYSGGIAGNNHGTISNCYSDVTLNGNYSGGIAGENFGVIENCYAKGNISGDYSGGLVSENSGYYNNGLVLGTISKSYAEVDIIGDYSGGFVAWNYDEGRISNCYATGNVEGDYSGGFAGWNYGGNIINSYATGNITGDYSGGFVSINENGSLILSSYSVGSVSGVNAGGFAYQNDGGSGINNCGWFNHEGNPDFAIYNYDGSLEVNITYNIENDGEGGFGGQWFYSKSAGIYFYEYDWWDFDSETPIWYEQSDDYPKLEPLGILELEDLINTEVILENYNENESPGEAEVRFTNTNEIPIGGKIKIFIPGGKFYPYSDNGAGFSAYDRNENTYGNQFLPGFNFSIPFETPFLKLHVKTGHVGDGFNCSVHIGEGGPVGSFVRSIEPNWHEVTINTSSIGNLNDFTLSLSDDNFIDVYEIYLVAHEGDGEGVGESIDGFIADNILDLTGNIISLTSDGSEISIVSAELIDNVITIILGENVLIDSDVVIIFDDTVIDTNPPFSGNYVFYVGTFDAGGGGEGESDSQLGKGSADVEILEVDSFLTEVSVNLENYFVDQAPGEIQVNFTNQTTIPGTEGEVGGGIAIVFPSEFTSSNNFNIIDNITLTADGNPIGFSYAEIYEGRVYINIDDEILSGSEVVIVIDDSVIDFNPYDSGLYTFYINTYDASGEGLLLDEGSADVEIVEFVTGGLTDVSVILESYYESQSPGEVQVNFTNQTTIPGDGGGSIEIVFPSEFASSDNPDITSNIITLTADGNPIGFSYAEIYDGIVYINIDDEIPAGSEVVIVFNDTIISSNPDTIGFYALYINTYDDSVGLLLDQGLAEVEIIADEEEPQPEEQAINPPTNLKAKTKSKEEIKLDWTDNSDNETNFQLERKKDKDNDFKLIKTLSANKQDYTDDNLDPKTKYTYRIRAINSEENLISDYSNQASAETEEVQIEIDSLQANCNSITLNVSTDKFYKEEKLDFKIELTNQINNQEETITLKDIKTDNKGKASLSLESLIQNTLYEVKVRFKKDDEDYSSWSKEEEIKTLLCETAPVEPPIVEPPIEEPEEPEEEPEEPIIPPVTPPTPPASPITPKPSPEKDKKEEKPKAITGAMIKGVAAAKEVARENPIETAVVSLTAMTLSIATFATQLNNLAETKVLLRTLFAFFSGIYTKRRKEWGVVFDSYSGKPIPLANVSIYNEEEKRVDQKLTDYSGAYSFLVPPGKYHLKTQKKEYTFDPQNIQSKAFYSDQYQGGQMNIEKDDIIRKDIPLTPEKGNYLDLIKRFKLKNFIFKLFFLTGFIFSFVVLLLHQSLWNYSIFSLYILSAALSLAMSKKPAWGSIQNEQGKPEVFATVKIFDNQTNQLKARTITDEKGRYFLILDKGSYTMEITSVSGRKYSQELSFNQRASLQKEVRLG
jgi:hypothetical protein